MITPHHATARSPSCRPRPVPRRAGREPHARASRPTATVQRLRRPRRLRRGQPTTRCRSCPTWPSWPTRSTSTAPRRRRAGRAQRCGTSRATIAQAALRPGRRPPRAAGTAQLRPAGRVGALAARRPTPASRRRRASTATAASSSDRRSVDRRVGDVGRPMAALAGRRRRRRWPPWSSSPPPRSSRPSGRTGAGRPAAAGASPPAAIGPHTSDPAAGRPRRQQRRVRHESARSTTLDVRPPRATRSGST